MSDDDAGGIRCRQARAHGGLGAVVECARRPGISRGEIRLYRHLGIRAVTLGERDGIGELPKDSRSIFDRSVWPDMASQRRWYMPGALHRMIVSLLNSEGKTMSSARSIAVKLPHI